jgi:hypothetical protein
MALVPVPPGLGLVRPDTAGVSDARDRLRSD